MPDLEADVPRGGSEEFGTGFFSGLIRDLRGHYAELTLVSLFVNLLALAVPVFVLQVYDRVVFFAGMSTLQGLVAGVVLALVFDFALRQARAQILQRVSVRIDATLSHRLYDKLTRLPLRVLENADSATWLTFQRDIERVRNTLGGAPATLVVDVPFALVFLALIAVIALPIAWVILIAVPVFVFVALLSSRLTDRASRREQDAAMGRDALLTELVAGRTTVKALDLGDKVRSSVEQRQARTVEAALERGRRTDAFANLGTVLSLLTTVAITGVGAIAILEHQITIGALIATNMLANRMIAPLNQLVGSWRSWAAFSVARRRLERLFAMAEERRESAIAIGRPRGEIGMEAVTFRYDSDGPPALEGISLNLRPGGLHGIVGRSGSGKSTLIKLMQGLYTAEQGRVTLDGADIAQYSRTDLSRWIGYVPQETFLLSGSVRDNLVRWPSGDADASVLRAARISGAHDFINELPLGYGADVGEAGRRLSGGQRQRLAIARALYGDPPVLLLDEPTANLDRPTEEQLRTALLELARDHNVVIVSHSPVLLSACENIIVLEKGRVAAAGPGSDILRRLFAGEGNPAPLERRT